jgi:CRISPR-associated protein Cas6
MVYVELRFPIVGDELPRCHERAMFRAISRLIPEAASAGWLLLKSAQARLSIRLPQSRVSLMLKLSGRRVEISRQQVRFGTPEISLLAPSSSLHAECITINGCADPDPFLDSIARRLDEMGIDGEIELGARRRFCAGRRVIRGFALTLHELNEEGSLELQERGLGSHRHLGCGFFVPVRNRVNRSAGEMRLYR